MKVILLSVNNVLVMKKGDDGQNLFGEVEHLIGWERLFFVNSLLN